MKYQRIFTFGCSLTDYHWPTWADVLSIQSKLPVYNAGRSGLGNVGISYRLVEYDQRFKFNEQDLIFILWTSWTREDRFINGNWAAYGNIFNNHLYDDKFIKKYWSWENDIIKNSSSIILVNKGYKITENYYYQLLENSIESDSALLDFYQKSFPHGPTFVEDHNFFNKKCKDGHPDILNHVNFYNTHLTKYGFPIVEQNSIFHTWQNDIENKLNNNQTDQEQKKIFKNYFLPHKHMFSIKN